MQMITYFDDIFVLNSNKDISNIKKKSVISNAYKKQAEFIKTQSLILNELEELKHNNNYCYNLQNDILIFINMVKNAHSKRTIRINFRTVKNELLCLVFREGDEFFDDRCYNCNTLKKYHRKTINKMEVELLQNLRDIFMKAFNEEM